MWVFDYRSRLPDDSILLLVERRPTEHSSKIREINQSLGLD